MDASAWIGVVAIGVTLLLAVAGGIWAGVKMAFMMGRHAQRLDAVEAGTNGNDCKTELAALNAQVEGLKNAFGEFKDDFRNEISGIRNALMSTGRARVRAVE